MLSLTPQVNDLDAGITFYFKKADVPKSDGTKGPGLQVRQVLGAGVTYKF
ncbi:hypothetical protein [Sphingobacterium hotanense]|uniref:Uncharacterized protein n=1 Tax=Sphingobacterium hotanense TaxID=649196 RepID=A0ABT7NS41_9SPHI|nr:hypothetical protein [Sphingobacterium hotanense]MDM1049999.1 hypothetical protein [Sphingobacterium hotanense]